MADELMTFFGRAFKESFTMADLSYGDHLWGSRRLMDALAGFYNTCVFSLALLAHASPDEKARDSHFAPSTVIKPTDIITGNGCSALLDQLFHVLVDAGEGCLLSEVTYAGFGRDLRPRSGTVLVGVPLEGVDGDDEGDVDARYGKSLRESEAKGIKVRARETLRWHDSPRG